MILYFYSRTYERCDVCPCCATKIAHISTHAPTRGATATPATLSKLLSISTHAPTRGATIWRQRFGFGVISTHAPTRGATQYSNNYHSHIVISTHAPTRGATGANVQPETIMMISTHAPTRGATIIDGGGAVSVEFLLTHLREVRRWFVWIILHITHFYSRTYERCDRMHDLPTRDI